MQESVYLCRRRRQSLIAVAKKISKGMQNTPWVGFADDYAFE